MNIIYTGRNGNIHSDMKDYIEKRLKKIKFYYDQIMNVDVILDIQKKIYNIEIKISANHDFFIAKDSGYDWDKVIDSVTDKIEREVKKKRDKVTEHKAKNIEKEAL